MTMTMTMTMMTMTIYSRNSDFWPRNVESVKINQITGPPGRTVHTGHTPSEKSAVGVNVLTVDKLLQLRNSLLIA